MELISREMAIDHMRVLGGEDRERLIGILNNKDILPTIEFRPKGKWETVSMEKGACEIFFLNKKCSNCGYEYCFPFNYNYCPECGAEMESE